MGFVRSLAFFTLLAIGTTGCAAAVVGAVAAGAGAGITYTLTNVASKTFDREYDEVYQATLQSLKHLSILVSETNRIEERGSVRMTKLTALTRDLTIYIAVERVSPNATRVTVDAQKDLIRKDKATATEILIQTSKFLGKA